MTHDATHPPAPAPELPDNLLQDVCNLLERHGLAHVPVLDVTTFLVRMLRGDDRRASTGLLYERAIGTFERTVTEFVRGERHAYVDAIAIVTGQGHAGIQRRVEALAASRRRTQ